MVLACVVGAQPNHDGRERYVRAAGAPKFDPSVACPTDDRPKLSHHQTLFSRGSQQLGAEFHELTPESATHAAYLNRLACANYHD